jgi:hypothetical protein
MSLSKTRRKKSCGHGHLACQMPRVVRTTVPQRRARSIEGETCFKKFPMLVDTNANKHGIECELCDGPFVFVALVGTVFALFDEDIYKTKQKHAAEAVCTLNRPHYRKPLTKITHQYTR